MDALTVMPSPPGNFSPRGGKIILDRVIPYKKEHVARYGDDFASLVELYSSSKGDFIKLHSSFRGTNVERFILSHLKKGRIEYVYYKEYDDDPQYGIGAVMGITPPLETGEHWCVPKKEGVEVYRRVYG